MPFPCNCRRLTTADSTTAPWSVNCRHPELLLQQPNKKNYENWTGVINSIHNKILANLHKYWVLCIHLKSKQSTFGGRQRLQQLKHVNLTHHTIAWFSQQLFNLQLVNTERILQKPNLLEGLCIRRFQDIHNNTPTPNNVPFFRTGPNKFDINPNWLLISGKSLPQLTMQT